MNKKELKEIIENINFYFKFTFNLALALGALLSISYFILIGYFPSGLSLGDVFFFVITVIAFIGIYLLITLGLFLGGVALTPFLRYFQKGVLYILKKTSLKRETMLKVNFQKLTVDYIGYAIVGLVIIIEVISIAFEKPMKALDLFLCMLAMSIIYGLWYTEPSNNSSKAKLKLGLVIAGFLVPLIIGKVYWSVLNTSMESMGMRESSVTMQFSEKHEALFRHSGIRLDRDRIHNDVNILFQGVGNKILIEVEGFKTEVLTQDVQFISKLHQDGNKS